MYAALRRRRRLGRGVCCALRNWRGFIRQTKRQELQLDHWIQIRFNINSQFPKKTIVLFKAIVCVKFVVFRPLCEIRFFSASSKNFPKISRGARCESADSDKNLGRNKIPLSRHLLLVLSIL